MDISNNLKKSKAKIGIKAAADRANENKGIDLLTY